MDQLYPKKGGVVVHNRYHPDNYIIEDLGHSWGTPLKNCLGAVFNKDLIRHLVIWETLHFQGFNMDVAF